MECLFVYLRSLHAMSLIHIVELSLNVKILLTHATEFSNFKSVEMSCKLVSSVSFTLLPKTLSLILTYSWNMLSSETGKLKTNPVFRT